MPFGELLGRFLHLLVAPFDDLGRAWPILPVYTTLILGELYKSKVGFSHAVGNGFAMLWAGLSWMRHVSGALSWIVAASAVAIGVFAIVLGFRKKDKALCEILGHTRFSCYFIITFYPMQAHIHTSWNWRNVMAILVFAIPCWFLIYLMGRLATRWIK